MPQCPTCQTVHGAEILICPNDGAAMGGILDQRYRVISLLGQGGMGAVYLAEHVSIQKKVALKVLQGELSGDPSVARRFELEAISASQIGHPSIVNVTDFGRTPEGALYSVMEYLDGQTLSDVLAREGRLPMRRAVGLVIKIARALEAAHAHGIVHRDLKPQNVMILRDPPGDSIKLLDFGISKVVNERAEKLTEHGQILGTAEYIAPEQVTAGPIDARADLYSLAVVTHELLTGKLPLCGSSTVAMLLQHLQTTPMRLRESAPDLLVPLALEEVVFKALSKKPADRQSSMAELIADLERAMSSMPPRPNHTRRAGLAIGVAGVIGIVGWALFQSPASTIRIRSSPDAGYLPATLAVQPVPEQVDVKLAKDALIPQSKPSKAKEGRSYSRVNNLKPPPF